MTTFGTFATGRCTISSRRTVIARPAIAAASARIAARRGRTASDSLGRPGNRFEPFAYSVSQFGRHRHYLRQRCKLVIVRIPLCGSPNTGVSTTTPTAALQRGSAKETSKRIRPGERCGKTSGIGKNLS